MGGTEELIYKTELESQMQKTNLWLRWDKWGGTNWETGIDMYTLLYIKQITNRNLPHSTGNSAQYSVMASMGKESLKKVGGCCICILIIVSFCCGTTITLEINYTPNIFFSLKITTNHKGKKNDFTMYEG